MELHIPWLIWSRIQYTRVGWKIRGLTLKRSTHWFSCGLLFSIYPLSVHTLHSSPLKGINTCPVDLVFLAPKKVLKSSYDLIVRVKVAPPERVFHAWEEMEVWRSQIWQIRGVVDDLVAAVAFLFQLLERIAICGVKYEGGARLKMLKTRNLPMKLRNFLYDVIRLDIFPTYQFSSSCVNSFIVGPRTFQPSLVFVPRRGAGTLR